jgi:HAD superfamily hydrolase (TIGR01509 family)
MTDVLFSSMIGRPDWASAELLRTAFGPDFDLPAASATCHAYFEEYVDKHGVPLKPGVTELLGDLSARNVPLAVATSTRRIRARELLQQTGLAAYFRALVGGDEVPRGKPAPDIYLEAVRRLGINPKVSFALEDSHAGVRAAHAAGLNVLMVPDLLPATEEIAVLARCVLPSLHEAKVFFAVPRPA